MEIMIINDATPWLFLVFIIIIIVIIIILRWPVVLLLRLKGNLRHHPSWKIAHPSLSSWYHHNYHHHQHRHHHHHHHNHHHHHHHCLNILEATKNLVFPDSDVGKPQVAHTTPGQNKKHNIETVVILSTSFVKSMKHLNPHLITPRLWRDQVTDSNTISFPGQSKHLSPFCGTSYDCKCQTVQLWDLHKSSRHSGPRRNTWT